MYHTIQPLRFAVIELSSRGLHRNCTFNLSCPSLKPKSEFSGSSVRSDVLPSIINCETNDLYNCLILVSPINTK